MKTMTYDETQSLWEKHAFADDDRCTELGDLSEIVHDLTIERVDEYVVDLQQWDNIIDDLHREHSEIKIDDLVEYLKYVIEEGNR